MRLTLQNQKRAFALAYGLALTFLVMFFHPGWTGNPMSRLLTVYALVEDHTLAADRWRSLTNDYAVIVGHTYSEKAPFSSFVVLPFYAVWRWIEGGPQEQRHHEIANHMGQLVASAIPFAIFGWMVLQRMLRRKGDLTAAWCAWVTAFALFGSMTFNYGNTYFGHMLAGLLLVGGWALVFEYDRHYAWAGCLGSLAVLTEYPIGLLEVMIVLFIAFDRARGIRKAVQYVLGAIPGAVSLGIYNYILNGNPLKLGYSQVNEEWKAMRATYGMNLPSPEAAWQLLFSEYRGLAFYAPVVLLLVPLWIAHREDLRRMRSGLLSFTAFWLLMASYWRWDGGWCTGPRFLMPALVLLLYEAAPLMREHARFRWLYVVLGCLGIMVNLAAAATHPIVYDQNMNPFFSEWVPAVMRNDITAHNIPTEYLKLGNGKHLLVVWAVLFALMVGALGVWLGRLSRKAEPSAPVVETPPVTTEPAPAVPPA